MSDTFNIWMEGYNEGRSAQRALDVLILEKWLNDDNADFYEALAQIKEEK